jgi:hypothetical protein
VIYKKAEIVSPHFAPNVANGCTFYDKHLHTNKGEGENHKNAKKNLVAMIMDGHKIIVLKCCDNSNIKLKYVDNIAIEHSFVYNGKRRRADIKLGDIIIEIRDSHKTKELDRPEPWCELSASDINNEFKSGDKIIKLRCLRDTKCISCEQRRISYVDRHNDYVRKVLYIRSRNSLIGTTQHIPSTNHINKEETKEETKEEIEKRRKRDDELNEMIKIHEEDARVINETNQKRKKEKKDEVGKRRTCDDELNEMIKIYEDDMKVINEMNKKRKDEEEKGKAAEDYIGDIEHNLRNITMVKSSLDNKITHMIKSMVDYNQHSDQVDKNVISQIYFELQAIKSGKRYLYSLIDYLISIRHFIIEDAINELINNFMTDVDHEIYDKTTKRVIEQLQNNINDIKAKYESHVKTEPYIEYNTSFDTIKRLYVRKKYDVEVDKYLNDYERKIERFKSTTTFEARYFYKYYAEIIDILNKSKISVDYGPLKLKDGSYLIINKDKFDEFVRAFNLRSPGFFIK